jgi:hypothetical protein
MLNCILNVKGEKVPFKELEREIFPSTEKEENSKPDSREE